MSFIVSNFYPSLLFSGKVRSLHLHEELLLGILSSLQILEYGAHTADSDKHYSLLRYRINWGSRSFKVDASAYHILYLVKCALFYIENDAEIFPVQYTWKVAEKGFKMVFMMNKLAMIGSCEIILAK